MTLTPRTVVAVSDDLVDIRRLIPWVGFGPLFQIATDSLPAVRDLLGREGFGVIELQGERMTSRSGAHAELAAAFEFPEYYGANWDSFNDCLGDFVEQHDGERIALVWNGIAAAAASAPATTAEVGWALIETVLGVKPTFAPGTTMSVEFAAFAVGDGPDFNRRPAY